MAAGMRAAGRNYFFIDFAQTTLNKLLGGTVDFNGFWKLSKNLILKGTLDFKRLSGARLRPIAP